MFQKILKVINAISQVILIITSLISLFTAYIVFAPEQLPKPFHLVYSDPNSVPVATIQTANVVQPTAVPTARAYLPGEGVMVNMSSKIINLVDPTGRKYIRITVVVEFAPDDPAYDTMTPEEKTTYLTQFTDQLNSKMPIMDDSVVTLLSTKTYEDLYTADGKEKLRTEILDDLSKKLPDLHILSIYFTEFVVQ